MTLKATTDRYPAELAKAPLQANQVAYYPSADGQDRLGSEHLMKYARAEGWADQAGTLILEESDDDGTTWAQTGGTVNVVPNDAVEFPWTELTKRKWRWKYTNGATAQGKFRLFEEKVADLPQVVLAGGAATVGKVDQGAAGTDAWLVEGDVAHDAADTGNPVKVGGKANVAAPVAVAENDRVNASFDLQGQQRVRVEDGADVTNGAKADAAQTDATQTASRMAFLKGIVQMLADAWNNAANALRVILTNSAGTEIGTAANPVRTDPTGTTTQPVSGTVTANQGTAGAQAWLVDVTDEAARSLGKVGLQVAGSDVANGNPVPVSDAGGALTVDGTVTANVAQTPTVGAHANAWNAAAVGANGTSTAIDCQYTPFVSAFGNVSAATTITVQYSQDNAAFYDGPSQTLAGAGDFRIDATVGARYVRLKSSGAATITATVAGKG